MGTVLSGIVLPDFEDSLPAAPIGRQNVQCQHDTSTFVAADGTTRRKDSFNFPNIGSVDARTTTAETISLASQGKLVTLTNSGAIAVTLNSSAVAAGFFCFVEVEGAGSATFTPGSGTIDGAASITLSAGQGAILFFDGTNWWSCRGMAGGLRVLAVVALSPSSPGNFTVAHGLAVTPSSVVIEMKSGGAIWFQSTEYDSTNLYLVASDAGITASAKVLG